MCNRAQSGRRRFRLRRPAKTAASLAGAALLVLLGSGCLSVPQRPLARDARRTSRCLRDWTASLRGLDDRAAACTLTFVTPAEMTARVRARGARGASASTIGWADVMAGLLSGSGVSTPPEDADFDRILGAQTAGYYDPWRREILLAIDDPSQGEERLRQDELLALTASHELVHAFDDARFGLERQIRTAPDDDAREALAALHEGMALSVNLDQYIGPRRLETLDDPALAGRLAAALERLWRRSLRGTLEIADVEGIFRHELGPGERETTRRFLAAPPWRRLPFLFRYFMGTAFVLEARRRFGLGILDRLATDPPRTTAQVLHPDRYLDRRTDPVRLAAIPRPGRSLDGAALFDGVMGELALCLILGGRPESVPGGRGGMGDDDLSLSGHWRGDRLTIWRSRGGPLLCWRILTDGEPGAERLAAALARRLEPTLEVSRQGALVRVASAGLASAQAEVPERLVRRPGREAGGEAGVLATLAAPLFWVRQGAIERRTRILGFLVDQRTWQTGQGDSGGSSGQFDLLAPAGLIGDGSWAGPLAGGWLFHRRVTAAGSETNLLFHLLGWRSAPALSSGEFRLQPLLRYRWGDGYGGLELGLGGLLTAESRADRSGRVLIGRLFDRAVLGWEWGAEAIRLHVLFLAIGG